MSKPRDPGKERFWRRMIQRWRRSGMSARAFCEDQGLSEPSLYAWQRTLRQRDAQATRFVPVQVLAGDGDETSPAATDAGAALAALELIVAGGRRLRIGAGFDESTLRRLLALLEEDRPCC